MRLPSFRPAWLRFLRCAFVALVARPVSLLWLGLNIRHRERLPIAGPAIVIANHNSHLDTLALLSLFPLSGIHKVRPVAAADYFMRNGAMAWCSRRLLGIIPIARGGGRRSEGRDVLEGCYAALARGETLIIFPEGTRGDAERLERLKSGVHRIASRFPDIPVIPVYMRGLGKSMPKGEFVPLPCFVDIYIGLPVAYTENKAAYMGRVHDAFAGLQNEHGRAAFAEDDFASAQVSASPTGRHTEARRADAQTN